MSTSSHSSAVRPRPNPLTIGCVSLFFGVFFLTGMAVFSVATVYPLLQALGATRWQETPCVVDSSRVAVSRGSKGGNTFRVEIVYRYRFEGRPYVSKRYQFATGSSSGSTAKQRIVDRYPPGTHAVCFVNPKAPAEAVIRRGLNTEMALGCFGLVFALVGGGGLFLVLRGASARLPAQPNAVPRPAAASGEAIALRPQSTPLGEFLVMLAFALFWNAFIGGFAYLTMHRGAPLAAKIFIGFFCFIGLLLILALIGKFFSLFDPRVQLTARAQGAPLGGEFQFDWSISGRAEKLRQIRITLEGREEVTSTSGENTSTRTQVFADIPILAIMVGETSTEGHGRVTIPAGLMHSFHGRSNRIKWCLRVRGELARSRQMDVQFPIHVFPSAVSA